MAATEQGAAPPQVLPVLQALPTFEPRRQTVPAPELGGSVIVRGLLAAEAFALGALRAQALRRVRELRVQHDADVAEARLRHQERCAALPANVAAPPEFEAPPFVQPDLTQAELRQYGRFGSELLALAVVGPSGLPLAGVDQWEVLAQHHPHLVHRLRAVAEELSGLNTEDVEKNSPPTPS